MRTAVRAAQRRKAPSSTTAAWTNRAVTAFRFRMGSSTV